ncbi:hypothetical protein RB195_011322 [Necator americanus]|uniref:Uncharacterized protein n=1 Tax=Necator americanus TaxID=51031 RepID=A0ABR1D1V4_NECAM
MLEKMVHPWCQDLAVGAVEPPIQALRVSDESLKMGAAWHYPDGTQHLSTLAASGRSPASIWRPADRLVQRVLKSSSGSSWKKPPGRKRKFWTEAVKEDLRTLGYG